MEDVAMKRQRSKKLADDEKTLVDGLPDVLHDEFVTKLCEAFPDLEKHTALLKQCHNLWRVVDQNKALGSREALTDGKIKDVPFVTTQKWTAVKDRFSFNEEKTCVRTLCRPKLSPIIDAVENNDKVFLWGNTGSGKSHLMSALAFHAFCKHLVDRAQPRVLFLPDLGTFAKRLGEQLLSALILAFFDSPTDLLRLAEIGEDFSKLESWTRTDNKSLLLVTDNHNAIDGGESAPEIDLNFKARLFVSGFNLCMQHKSVNCASANQRSVELAVGKQDGTTKVSLFGGAELEELKSLSEKYPAIQQAQAAFDAAKVAYEQDEKKQADFEEAETRVVKWDRLMSATGGVPRATNLLLKSYSYFSEAAAAPDFDEFLAEWEAHEADLIKSHLKKFFRMLKENEKLDSWANLLAGATSGLLGPAADHHLVDCAFFYPGLADDGTFDWSRLSPTSDLVRRVAIDMWMDHQDEQKQNWRDTLTVLLPTRRIANASMKGFIDEKIALTILSKMPFQIKASRPSGLGHTTRVSKALALKVDVGKVETFIGQWSAATPHSILPNLKAELETLSKESKFLMQNPKLWNYKAADSVVAGLVVTPKKQVIVEIQVTHEKPSGTKKACKTAEFFGSTQWKLFAYAPFNAWQQVILWISDDGTLPTLADDSIFQAHLSFKTVFELGNFAYD